MDIYDFEVIQTAETLPGRCGAVLASWCCTPWYPEPMPVNRSTTRRLTVNLPSDVADAFVALAQDRGLSSSALAAKLLAASVRSLTVRGRPPLQMQELDGGPA